MLLIPIFQKGNSFQSHSNSAVCSLFKDPPTGAKVCSTSGDQSKFPYSYVTYFLLPYFRVEKVWEPSGDRPWQGIFLWMSQRPQRYFQLVIIGQNFFIHMSHISCCHISENKNFRKLWQISQSASSRHRQTASSRSPTSPKRIFQ